MPADSGETPSDTGTTPGLPHPVADPEWIGPYRLLRVLGEGGMGVVYLAEQTEPIRRRVALKVIKLGMDTREVVARFESERQALAVMDHPNIARVFDGGATETGRPYFVMELVQGIPINDYCDTHRLGTDERIRLFTDVCGAVQHAHLKGLIHRDLKPSNILVALSDGKPFVKIIDFGIAKATGLDLTDSAGHTHLGKIIGTPEYMSPEQAEMSGLDVDTRSDVYSLGVVLYELLVGTLPFQIRNRAEYALGPTIREAEVPRPSARFSTLGNAGDRVAHDRGTTSEHLRKALKGDLDWIVLKAMEKDRTRRYATANGFALDLERYLANEPVRARPPSAAYRVGKFVRRNRAGVLAAAVVLLTLSGASVAVTVGFVRAVRAERLARQEAETARQVSDFLVGIFELSDPDEAQGNSVTAREILDRGARDIERDLGDQPVVQSRLMGTMGDVYRSLGLYDPSVRLLQEALAVRERTLPPDHPDVAESLRKLGLSYRLQGRFDEAEPLLERALEIYERSSRPNAPELANTLRSLAALYIGAGRYDEAVPLLDRALSINEAAHGPESVEVAWTLSDLGSVYFTRRQIAEAEPYYERALEIWEAELGPNHPDLASGFNNLGAVYWMQEKYDEAEGAYERARAIWELTLEPGDQRIAMILNNLAETYWIQKDYDRAEGYFLRSLAIKEETLSPDHPSVAYTMNGLANVYRDQGRFEEAELLYRHALRIREAVLGSSDPNVAATLDDMAKMLRAAGRNEEARTLEVRARAIRPSSEQGP